MKKDEKKSFRCFLVTTVFDKFIFHILNGQFVIITIYNTVILVRSVRKFLDRNFLFIEKVQAFSDLILSRALTRDKYNSKRQEPARYRENLSP